MKRFSVYVERLVPQWTRVVVAAESEELVQQTSQRIYETASQERTDWEYEDNDASEPSGMEVAEISPEDYHDFDEPLLTLTLTQQGRELKCDNCGEEFREYEMVHQYPDIPNLLGRIEPGDAVPLGECPACGALVHDSD